MNGTCHVVKCANGFDLIINALKQQCDTPSRFEQALKETLWFDDDAATKVFSTQQDGQQHKTRVEFLFQKAILFLKTNLRASFDAKTRQQLLLTRDSTFAR